MIISKDYIFDNNVFQLSDSLEIETKDIGIANITIIDNFYKNIEEVFNEIEKLPMTLIYDESDNNKNYFDARKSYCSNMNGTEIPYQYNNQLKKLVSQIIEYPSNLIGVNKSILVNCFKFTDKLDLQNNYYTIHVDSFIDRKSKGQLAIVIFLNENYEEGEGINFYEYKNYQDTLLTPKDCATIIHSVQGKSNRAVLFDSQMPHGQYTPTSQFKKEIRQTQVIFIPTY